MLGSNRERSASPRVRTCGSARQRRKVCAASRPANCRPTSAAARRRVWHSSFSISRFCSIWASRRLLHSFGPNRRTFFQIDTDQARSETTIELQWVRGRLFEVELGVAAGLQVVSVGPPDVVESSHLTSEISGRDRGETNPHDRRLRIRLTPLGRGQNKSHAQARWAPADPARGLGEARTVHSRQTTSVSASYALVADRGLALELDDDRDGSDGPATSSPHFKARWQDWPWASLRKEISPRPTLAAGTTAIPGLSDSNHAAWRDRFTTKRCSRPRSWHAGSTCWSGRP